jgi:hypothetical protein
LIKADSLKLFHKRICRIEFYWASFGSHFRTSNLRSAYNPTLYRSAQES